MKKKLKPEPKTAGMVIVCPEDPKKPGVYGKRSKNGKCPKCGSKVDPGFGLSFGGFGPYETCRGKKCNWFRKVIYRETEG